ncbi:methyltransferase domain-containing protein [Sphingopyxis yananensis]|uniref:methyltransferase domain-containing protein n=1 Tax=Sphingopyxis yananensis TaxID=2886687 RepID=UPI001D10FFD9|nr:methyltransferase domain-containing protein [Sphingopyxis yananensis]MCC2602567.1 methyltransferase domain-containing protein [Sphingopyxis yananensis]
MTSPPEPAPIFSLARHAAQRDRMMTAAAGADFLQDIIRDAMLDQLSMVTRQFSRALIVGAHDRALVDHITQLLAPSGGSVDVLESGPAMARRYAADQGDAETLDRPLASYDLIIWHGGLDAVQDVPAALLRMRALLAPDGLLMGAFLGDGSLPKLRRATMADGVRPVARMHPQIDLSSMGNLLQRIGFAMPVVDVDALNVRYGDMLALVRDLRANGLSSRLTPTPSLPTRTEVAHMAAAFADQADPDGRVSETFRIIYFSGWAPDPSQPKPAKRGSATASLADALKAPKP